MPLGPGLLDELLRILGPDGLVASAEGRLVYECDMHTFYKGAPDVVALPESTAEVVAIVRLCRGERVPIVPRGDGPAGADQSLAHARGAGAGMVLRARSLEPDGLVHRRQRVDQRRRAALSQVRHHRQPRPGARAGHGRG